MEPLCGSNCFSLKHRAPHLGELAKPDVWNDETGGFIRNSGGAGRTPLQQVKTDFFVGLFPQKVKVYRSNPAVKLGMASTDWE